MENNVGNKNSYTLRIIGTAELPASLEMGYDHIVAGRVSIVSIEKQDNMDGTFTFAHKGKLTHIELVNKAGQTFKGVAKGSKSQKLRWRIMQYGDNDYYEQVMEKIIVNLEQILESFKI